MDLECGEIIPERKKLAPRRTPALFPTCRLECCYFFFFAFFFAAFFFAGRFFAPAAFLFFFAFFFAATGVPPSAEGAMKISECDRLYLARKTSSAQ